MGKKGLALMAAMLLTFGTVGFDQTQSADRSEKTDRKASVTYGRIKEITPARVVLDVDNSPDKSFDLTDKEKTFHVGKGLKVGDPVMASERKINGKDVIEITEHAGGDVKHGDKTKNEEIQQAPKK